QAQSQMPLGLDSSAGPSRIAPPLSDERSLTLAPGDSPLQRALRGEEFDAVTVWAGEPGTKRSAFQVTARHLGGDAGRYDGSVVVSRNITAELSAVRARDDLIASVSHELRTPLTSILGYLELVIDSGELTSATTDKLAIAYRNANRLLELVADILSASRDGMRPLTLTLASCDLVDIVTQSVESLEPRARERGIRVDILSKLPTAVIADGSRLRQVVDNVLSNAIKYNVDNGAVTIEMSEQDGTVRLEVRDTGIGIPEDEQPRLFEHFFRSEAVRNSSVHGSGLGLGISRDLMRRHGGDLTVRSAVGDGTTVLLTLPTAGRASEPRPALTDSEETYAV
ncbi:MAG: HAMP domain-containing sensor histidine kinase, partial [Microbacteriaceae bacterium]